MIISELIAELERVKEQYGDVLVVVDTDCGDEVVSEVVLHTVDDSEEPNAVMVW